MQINKHTIKRIQCKEDIEFYSTHEPFIDIPISTLRYQAERMNYEAKSIKCYECESMFLP